ncbi:transporter [Luteococcus japonicus LSP_Lj1]|uniref:Transporter n=1 Tax=Luteococcus japonicus LSP_Lj1 TaxID=1255658 RepID=A0A1R4JYI4_9ACTN|nr:transporter [Luteococcus japonicus LSP_Lj1]
MMAGGVVSVIGMWLCFNLIQSTDHMLIWLGFVALVGLVQPAQYGPIGAFLSEKFDPDHRYTGAGMTFQMASIIGAGTAPLVAGRLVNPQVGLTNLAIYGTVLFLISTVAIFVSKETARRQTHQERFIEEAVFEA